MKTVLSKNIGLILTLVGLLASLLGSAAFPTDARADALTWYVATTGDDANDCATPATPCATINGAIGKAANGDTIQSAVGTYTDSGTEVVLINKSITLSGGWTDDFTTQNGMSTIDGQGARIGITLSGQPGVVGVIDRFKIENGNAASCNAGGINVPWGGTTLTISNSIIRNNENTCSGGGGGIGTNGNTTINNSTISTNIGGGIESHGMVTINNSTVSNNTNGSSGGGISNHGTLVLNNSTVSDNTTTWNNGGGIYNMGTLTLNNSTVSGNKTLNICGGGITNERGTITLLNSTVSFNSASRGGGVCNSSHTTITLTNSIIAMNTKTGTYDVGVDCIGNVSSSGYNLIGNNSGCTFTATTGDKVGTSAHAINPRLGPLRGNGGSTFTSALLAGSPAINAGNPGTCLLTDQRGIVRPEGSACEIGAYEVDMPIIASIKRLDPNPTSASRVRFKVTFSEAVTGVDTNAPFNDFALTKTGVTGAAITAVTGSGDTYTVSVNTGSGNGTIRLDVVDDDSLLDTSGNPLGGVGLGNGNFTTGEQYSVLKIPTPLAPGSTIIDTTPTYQWNKIPEVTFYQYELAKSGVVVYTKTVAASTCGTTNCQSTPTTILTKGSYKWRVRAMIGGSWRGYSAYKSFTLAAPKAGFWTNTADVWFYVAPSHTNVNHFSMRLWVSGCDNVIKPTNPSPVSIVDRRFSFDTGNFYVKGIFDTISSVYGTFKLKSFYVPGCGYIDGGPWSWIASWKNDSQPASSSTDEDEPIMVVPLEVFPSGYITVEPVNP